jgi:hypothetical protein
VPKTYKEDPSLGRWVYAQHTRFKAGKLDPERKRMIDEIGLAFNSTGMTNKENWNLQFQKLRDYNEKHGHCEFFWAVDRFSFVLNNATNTPTVALPVL